MEVYERISDLRTAVRVGRNDGKTIGFVPTMGALHAGHASLIDAARAQCGFVVVSIFVNPTQFGPAEDLSRYPRTPQQDLRMCLDHGADAIFMPPVDEMYPGVSRASCPRVTRASRSRMSVDVATQIASETCNSGTRASDNLSTDSAVSPAIDPGVLTLTEVSIRKLGEHLCGASRPGHFTGVCTVVAKLFNIVQPDNAFFGAKDFQQATILRQMAADLNFPLEVVVCPTLREADGLAMSSRNTYLTPEFRRQAPALHHALQMARRMILDGRPPAGTVAQAIQNQIARMAPSGQIDYVQIVDLATLAPVDATDAGVCIALAVKFGSTRLIDNIVIEMEPSAGSDQPAAQ